MISNDCLSIEWINTVSVKNNKADNILGDKLTAFAPETAGIPYERNGQSMAMEIMKQLYDIGSLFNHCSDVKSIKEAFSDFAIHQLKTRLNKLKKSNPEAFFYWYKIFEIEKIKPQS